MLQKTKRLSRPVLLLMALALTAAVVGVISHVNRSQAQSSCTIYVATTGSDANSGNTQVSSLRTPAAAVSQSGPGDVVCFAPGTYTSSNTGSVGALHIQDKNGSSGNPITFTSLDPGNRAIFSMGSVDAGASISAVFIQRSSYINIDNVEVTDAFRAVTGNGVHHVNLTNSYLHHIGGEIVYFGKRAARIEPDVTNNPASHTILIEGNEIAFSGQRTSTGRTFGEGIYIGTSVQSYNDTSNTITIRSNVIHDVIDEGVDVKTLAYNVDIIDNRVYNINLHSQAAINVAIHGYNTNDGDYEIIGNEVTNVTTRAFDGAGIWVGHGNTRIEDNTIWDVAIHGIIMPATYNLSGSRDVTLRNNIICSSGSQSIDWGDPWGGVIPNPPNVDVDSSNQTWDGAHGTTQISSSAECVLTDPPVGTGIPPSGGTGGNGGSSGGSGEPGPPEWVLEPGYPDEELFGYITDVVQPEEPLLEVDQPTDTIPVADVQVECSGGPDDNELLCEFIRYANFFSLGVVVVAAITIAVSGAEYATARGNSATTARAVGRITKVGIGLLAYVFGWAFLNWLIPGGAL